MKNHKQILLGRLGEVLKFFSKNCSVATQWLEDIEDIEKVP